MPRLSGVAAWATVLCIGLTAFAAWPRESRVPASAAALAPTGPDASDWPRPKASVSPPRPRPVKRLVTIRRVVPIRRAARTALVIGVNDNNPKHRALGSATDAGYMRAALLEHGFRPEDITMLVNEQATRPRVLHELARLVVRTSGAGLAVLAVSSHGSAAAFRTTEGAHVSATEVASYLRRIPGRVWTALAMCYAGAFALPGIVGPNRIATFSSDARHLSYEAGGAGSDLYLFMIEMAMVQGLADGSIEQAFAYARSRMGSRNSSSTPVLSDGIPGNTSVG